MKKLILAAAVTSLFATSAMANSKEDINEPFKGTRIEAGYVSHDGVDFDNTYDGFVIAIGYDVDENIGYSARISQAEDDYLVYGRKATETIRSFGGYVDYGHAFALSESFFAKPYILVGVEIDQLEVEYLGVSASESEAALAYGAGVRVTAMENVSVSAEIKRSLVKSDYDVDFDTITVMAGYKF